MRRLGWVLIAGLLLSSAATQAAESIYDEQCALCHQPDAAGAAGLAPPLRDRLKHYAASAAGRSYMAQLVVSGMVGMIKVDDQPFIGKMPPFEAMEDDVLATTLNDVLARFNGITTPLFTPADIAAARALHPTPTGTRRQREALLAGE